MQLFLLQFLPGTFLAQKNVKQRTICGRFQCQPGYISTCSPLPKSIQKKLQNKKKSLRLQHHQPGYPFEKKGTLGCRNRSSFRWKIFQLKRSVSLKRCGIALGATGADTARSCAGRWFPTEPKKCFFDKCGICWGMSRRKTNLLWASWKTIYDVYIYILYMMYINVYHILNEIETWTWTWYIQWWGGVSWQSFPQNQNNLCTYTQSINNPEWHPSWVPSQMHTLLRAFFCLHVDPQTFLSFQAVQDAPWILLS